MNSSQVGFRSIPAQASPEQASKAGEIDKNDADLLVMPSQMALVGVRVNNSLPDQSLGARKTAVHSGNEQKGYLERLCETFFPSLHQFWRELRGEQNRPVYPENLSLGEVFDLLGIDESIRLDELDEEKIKNLFTKALLKYHPDKNLDDQESANEYTRKITASKEFMLQAVRTGEFKSTKQRLEQGYI